MPLDSLLFPDKLRQLLKVQNCIENTQPGLLVTLTWDGADVCWDEYDFCWNDVSLLIKAAGSVSPMRDLSPEEQKRLVMLKVKVLGYREYKETKEKKPMNVTVEDVDNIISEFIKWVNLQNIKID